MSKQNHNWQDHTEENPFHKANAPIEVWLVDGSRETFMKPAKNKKEYGEIVERWRYIPKELLATR